MIPLGSEGDYRGKKPTKGSRNLQLLWLQRMVQTRSPLREKMPLFWHNHFATANSKVNNPYLMARQNDLFRRLGLGRFGDLLLAVSRDPAMLIWLNGNANHRRAPNENYAREVMELFTLGIGNYTEDDVHAAARAFTGWHVHDDEFVYQDSDHDHAVKTYLGHTGDLSGEDVVAILAAHPATARFLSAKLWRWFAHPSPETQVIDDLAAVYLQTGGDLSAVLRALFLHDAFYSDRTMTGQIKNPAEFVVQTLWALGQPADMAAVNAMSHMGMELFNLAHDGPAAGSQAPRLPARPARVPRVSVQLSGSPTGKEGFPMRLTRRDFILASSTAVVGLGALGLGTIWAVDGSTLRQVPTGAGAPVLAEKGRVLVVCQLSGGNDGLNTLIPWGDGRYYALRPNLAIREADTIALTNGLGLNPGLKAIKPLFDAGQVAVLQNVGYPSPNRSHFRSMEIWQTAQPQGTSPVGWLGRLADITAAPGDSPLKAVAVGAGPRRWWAARWPFRSSSRRLLRAGARKPPGSQGSLPPGPAHHVRRRGPGERPMP